MTGAPGRIEAAGARAAVADIPVDGRRRSSRYSTVGRNELRVHEVS
jgi:hypothetical protein